MAKITTIASYHHETTSKIAEENMFLPCEARIPRQWMLSEFWTDEKQFWEITYKSWDSKYISITDANNKIVSFPIYDESI